MSVSRNRSVSGELWEMDRETSPSLAAMGWGLDFTGRALGSHRRVYTGCMTSGIMAGEGSLNFQQNSLMVSGSGTLSEDH